MKPKKIKLEPCMGIPVVYDPGMALIADSRGIWRWKTIFVGPTLMQFPPREQQAIILHEVGHCKLRHVERRILALWRIFWPPALLRLCVLQELQADRFAAGCGYGPDLARVFARVKTDKSPFHPPVEERIARLVGP